MSASLVGSEMCIRDSLSGSRVGYMRADGGVRCIRFKNCWSSKTFSEPVSYTHLTLPTICSV
eukprot:2631967-Alexandrium_andersonii.AAC.1